MIKFNFMYRLLRLISVLTITTCANSADPANTDISINPTALNQAAYAGGTVYNFGFNSIDTIPFINAPADTDFTRYAMLHDGTTYRLYFFKQGSSDTIYQFGYNSTTQKYEYGFDSIPILKITGIPTDADSSSFAMLFDGTTYRLYLKRTNTNTVMYQFGFNSTSGNYEYGFNSIPILFITQAPSHANFNRWSMLHDGTTYRLYIGKNSEQNTLYQFAFNPASSNYEWGFNSIPELQIKHMPSSSIKSNFSMLHDGSAYRFYYPATQ